MGEAGSDQVGHQRAGGDWHAHLREWKKGHPDVRHKEAQRLAKETFDRSSRHQAKRFIYEYTPARRILLPDTYADEFADAPEVCSLRMKT